jgi:hypothetical protein
MWLVKSVESFDQKVGLEYLVPLPTLGIRTVYGAEFRT